MEYLDFEVPLTSKLEWDDPNNISESLYQCRVFYEPGVPVRGIIPYFYGSSTSHTKMPPTDPFPVHAVQNGYCFIQIIPIPVIEFPVITGTYTYFRSSAGMSYAYECESLFEYIFTQLVNEPLLAGVIDASSLLYVTGTSRGAIAFLQWSQGGGSIFSSYKDKVVNFFVNSPSSGGTGEGRWYDASQVNRFHYGLIENCRHSGTVVYGKNDRTHANRSMMEKINFFKTNNRVTILLPENPDYTHTWPSIYPQDFIEMAVTKFGET